MTRYRVGDRTLDVDRHEVIGPDGPVDFEPQVFDVLVHLIESAGELVTKENLLDNVWGDRFVSESALTTRIKEARRVLGDDGRTQWAIKTVHGRGYRFVAEVDIDAAASATPPPTVAAVTAGDNGGLPRQVQSMVAVELVGRSSELDEVDAHRSQAVDLGRWVWLLGEPGIGKSRLAAEVARDAHEAGARVLFGRCNEDLAVPYQPIIEALRSATGELAGDALLDVLGERSNDLVRLLPDLAQRVEGLALSLDGDPASEKYRLFDAVGSWLGHLAGQQPVVLVIDDLHWATDSTLQLIRHLHDTGVSAALTIVVTARDTAPDLSNSLADLLAAVAATPEHLALRLDGLDVTAVAELDLGLVGVDASEILRETAGNPLLLQSLAGAQLGASSNVEAAVRRRLSGLADEVQETLAVAAVVGLDFDLRVLAAAVRRDEIDVLAMLEQAVDSRLLSEVGIDRFSFHHALVRAALRDRLSAGRRTRWHGRIAEAIEEVQGVGSDPLAVAHHYAEASLADPSLRPVAVERLRAAATTASEQLSFPDAADLLDRALSLVDQQDRRLIAELTLERGEAETFAGLSVTAMRSFESAFADAQLVGDPDLIVRAALDFEDVTWRPGHHGGPAVERLRIALDVVADDRRVERVRLLVGLSRALSLTGDRRGALEASQLAGELAADLDDPELQVRVLSTRLTDVGDEGTPRSDHHDLRRLEQLIPLVKNWDLRLLALQVVQRDRARYGEFAEYREAHDQYGRLVSETRSTFWRYVWANNDAMLALFDGDLVGAEQRTERCMEIAADLPGEENSGTFGLRMFVIRREQDALRSLAPLVKHLLSTNAEESFWRPGLALMLAETGATDEAAELLAEFRAADFRSPPDAMWTTLMVLMIELAVLLDDVDACDRLRRRFAPQEGTMIVTGHGIMCLGAADRYLGMLASRLGDLDEAARLLRSGIERDDTSGSPLWAGHGRVWLARTLAASGDVDEARYLALQVSEQIAGRDFVRLEASVAVLQAELG